MNTAMIVLCSFVFAGFLGATPAMADDDDDDRNKSSPFQIQRGNLTPGDFVEVGLVEVPLGKRLVMQYVSLNATSLAEDVVNVNCRLEVERANPGVGRDPTLDLVVTTDRNDTAFDGHLAGGPITLYGEAGDRVVASCNVVGLGLVNSLSATLVGHLVKAKSSDDDDD